MAIPFGVIEHVPIPAYVFRMVDDEFILEFVNAAARARNPALASLQGKPMAALYRDQPQVLADARRAVAEQVTVTLEQALRRYDRTEATQYARLSFVPAPDSHLVVYMEELHSAELTEAAVRESESRYASLVASLPDGLLLRGSDGRVLACNDIAVEFLGMASQADLLGKREVLGPGYSVQTESGEAIDQADAPSLRTLATGKPEPGRVLAITSGAATRWVRVASQPIRTSSGALTGSVTTLSDITERLLAQRAQRESAERLDLALVAARMGVWEYDPTINVGSWSENLDEIFKMVRRSPTLESFAEALHPDDLAAFATLSARLLSNGDETSFQHELRIVGVDGVTRWAHVHGRLSREPGRARLVGTVIDVTERHHLEEELHRAHRLESIGRLAGGIAHDFNNLLAAILGSVELVESQCPPSAKEDLDTIEHAAIRARDLTKQLLAFARKQPVELAVVDLGAMVTKVELMLRRLVGPSIDLSITTSPVCVQADVSSLEQVVVNLVVNARDAMPNGGRLEVRVGPTKESLPGTDQVRSLAMIEVADSGIGMDEQTLSHAFDPFFTTKTHGTGLGLASSYGTVKQHGGDIVVVSQTNRGTCFRVLLPELTGAAPIRPTEPKASTREDRRGCVLVLDDEELVRKTAARLVASLGYEVLTAANDAEALRCALEHDGPIDVLLCDVAMPGRDGPSVARELRAAQPLLKVIFVSGYADAGRHAELARETFLQKPYSRDELVAKLAELEEAPKAHES